MADAAGIIHDPQVGGIVEHSFVRQLLFPGFGISPVAGDAVKGGFGMSLLDPLVAAETGLLISARKQEGAGVRLAPHFIQNNFSAHGQAQQQDGGHDQDGCLHNGASISPEKSQPGLCLWQSAQVRRSTLNMA